MSDDGFTVECRVNSPSPLDTPVLLDSDGPHLVAIETHISERKEKQPKGAAPKNSAKKRRKQQERRRKKKMRKMSEQGMHPSHPSIQPAPVEGVIEKCATIEKRPVQLTLSEMTTTTKGEKKKEREQRVRGECGRKGCMTCPYMKGSTGQFKSTVTGKEYQVLGDNMLNCASKNVVYLTSCVKCGVQYIGKTIQVLSKRQNLNRNQGKGHIEKYGVPHVSCRRLIEHFYGGKECNETHIRVQPIEQVTLEKGMEEKTKKEKAAEIDLRLGRAECR
jgi:hypothetical protein